MTPCIGCILPHMNISVFIRDDKVQACNRLFLMYQVHRQLESPSRYEYLPRVLLHSLQRSIEHVTTWINIPQSGTSCCHGKFAYMPSQQWRTGGICSQNRLMPLYDESCVQSLTASTIRSMHFQPCSSMAHVSGLCRGMECNTKQIRYN